MRSLFKVYGLVLLAAIGIADGLEPGSRVMANGRSWNDDVKPSILVNPGTHGNGTAETIQEAIDSVPSGGKVLVLPGTYAETLTITKGLTLEAIGGASGDVIVSPPGTPDSVVEVATSEPVTLRGVTVHVPGLNGIRAVGEVDITVEGAAVLALNPLAAASSNLIVVSNDLLDGSRARMVVRDSFLDGGMTTTPVGQSFALRPQGNVDALLERNVIRRAGGACIFVVTRADLGGETNVDILDNDLDECHPVGRVSAILVGPLAANQPSATRPLTATGTVNIVGNTIRNSSNFCLRSAIAYEVYSGRIEHNVITDYVKPCAAATSARNRASAIWIGRLSSFPFPAVTPTVRFNDLEGNAEAGLRIAPNQTIPIDGSCNFWGSELGPSGAGSGDGSAVIVDSGGALPFFVPFAAAPIAGTGASEC
ncbi:MAG TPA: hypothetical protein VFO67_08650 [Gemmatimonadales bacterium]|nr:hypothetical protein [Gemmatimonadales bacterium]